MTKEEEKEMLKKFGYSLVVVGALMLSVGVVNTGFVGSAKASEEPKEKSCEKCEHLPSKPEADCKCECHKAAEKPKEEKCEKCGHLPSKTEGDCRCDCHHRHK